MIRALCAAAALLAAPAYADCIGVADATVMLVQEGWTAHSGGVSGNSTVTVYTHPERGWIVVYVTDGQACIVASGEAWGTFEPDA